MTPPQKPGRSKQDYGTPPEFLSAVKRRLGIKRFDCDLAASAENAVVRNCYYTKSDDALRLRSWLVAGGWNWLNPPYSNIAPWVKRACLERDTRGVQTAVLIPAAVGSNWWRDWVHEKARVRFLNPRLTFVGCKDPYPKDCALLLYDDADSSDFYDVWTWRTSGAVSQADAEILSSSEGTAMTSALDRSGGVS